MRILKKTLTLGLTLSFAFGLSLLALSLSGGSASAASQDDTYTAKAGDSYTELARSSVIKYDQATDSLTLNAAQVTAAETWVTQEAGSPAINVGQTVTVSKTSVEKFAKQAAELSDAAKARWKKYSDVSSISNGELKDKVKSTTSEDTTARVEAEKKAKEESTDANKDSSEEQAEDKEDDENATKTSRRWIIVAIIVLLVLAAVTLIRSSNVKED
jgi:hypothetical protein